MVSENPYLKEQTSQREDANKSAEIAKLPPVGG